MRPKSKLFYSYVLFVLLYGGFLLLPAPPPATLLQYHVSALGLRIIDATLLVLMVLIWFAAFYGYAKVRAYAQLIQNTKDGRQVAKLSKGILLIVIWLPVSSTLSSILNFIALKNPGFVPAAKIIENYIGILLPLLGFIFISKGARGLSEIVDQRPSYLATNLLATSLIYIGLIYAHLVMATKGLNAVYHMSVWLILLTLVAPYLYMWFIGLLAVYEIYLYRRKVKGVVYKRSWGQLSFGLGWFIIITIALQYLTTLSPHLVRMSIYGILAIIYTLLLLIALGFILIASGTRKLQRIEEV